MSAGSERLYVRTDAAPGTGVGHFMRCLALAQHWRDLGLAVTFIGRWPTELDARLAEENIARVSVAAPHPDPRDLDFTLDALPHGAVVVLDGYHFDETYQRALDARVQLLVIDDFAHLSSYAGWALLNANLDAERVVYRSAPERRLLGPRYLLLRRTLRTARNTPERPPAAPRAERILVSCGGSDPENLTLGILETLAGLEPPPREVRVIVGPLNPHRASLATYARERPWIELLTAPWDVAPEMRRADLAIAAAGTTTWELALCGVPSVLIAAADNQMSVALAMERHKAAVFAGDAVGLERERLAIILADLIGDAELRGRLAARASALVDGDGVVRVTQVLREGLSNHAHR